MPKRSFDLGPVDTRYNPLSHVEKSQRKTERSHEENQERAYVAASRRADRSLEARVQSARMASEIHKKRTGKGFRITEQIVMKEEMYEEEDDDLPRSYKLLGPSMQTASPIMNARVEAYLSNKVAMSKLLARTHENWQESDIHREFAEAFPNVGQQSLNLSHRMSQQMPPLDVSQHMHSQQMGVFMPPPVHQRMHSASGCFATSGATGPACLDGLSQNLVQPGFQKVDYAPSPQQLRGQSVSSVSPTEFSHREDSPFTGTPESTVELGRHESPSSGLISPETPVENFFRPPGSSSAFTTELPAEAKMIMGHMHMNGTYDHTLFHAPNWEQSDSIFTGAPSDLKMDQQHFAKEDTSAASMRFDIPTQNANLSDDSWEAFINDNAWATEL